ncbi:hypothetical protein L3Y34_000437 [Caenorhabditis briggsae]|uniref:Uncharacterized protein n=1 Tax=Caenorhabditis briggsae TaxID=6238 RepID=A0AAE9IM15_CAEBR|nr:hypothetical protein L3Y34_000437 [Caenorhabditis briggsae]
MVNGKENSSKKSIEAIDIKERWDVTRGTASLCAFLGRTSGQAEPRETVLKLKTHTRDSRSPKDDDQARLPREDGEDRQDRLHRDGEDQVQEEEGIQELDPPQDCIPLLLDTCRNQELIHRGIYRLLHNMCPLGNPSTIIQHARDREAQESTTTLSFLEKMEKIVKINYIEKEVGYDWSFDTSPGYSPEPRADTPGYDEQPTAQHVPPQQPIYERTPRAQLPEPQVRYQRAPEPPAVHAPFNFDIRDEQALRYWNDAPESLKLQGVVDNLQVEAKKLLNLIDGVLPPMNLNKSQLLVVRISMNEDRPLVCIQGGPGTGKTYTHKLFSKKKTNYSRMESKIKFPGENGVIRIDQLNSYLFI